MIIYYSSQRLFEKILKSEWKVLIFIKTHQRYLEGAARKKSSFSILKLYLFSNTTVFLTTPNLLSNSCCLFVTWMIGINN